LFNSPRVHFMRNALGYAGKTQRRIVSAWIGTAFAQDDAAAARKQWREVADQVRWSLDFGQVVKLGSPFGEDGPYGGQTEAVFS
jgi:transposase-like protein